MKVNISFEFDTVTDSDDIVTWLDEALGGGSVKKTKKARKTRPPMTDEEKAAFRARMVNGQKEAEKARTNETDIEIKDSKDVEDKVTKTDAIGKELPKGSGATEAKKPAANKAPGKKKDDPNKHVTAIGEKAAPKWKNEKSSGIDKKTMKESPSSI